MPPSSLFNSRLCCLQRYSTRAKRVLTGSTESFKRSRKGKYGQTLTRNGNQKKDLSGRNSPTRSEDHIKKRVSGRSVSKAVSLRSTSRTVAVRSRSKTEARPGNRKTSVSVANQQRDYKQKKSVDLYRRKASRYAKQEVYTSMNTGSRSRLWTQRKPPPSLNAKNAQELVLYKDDDIIAINKPAGLAVHSGPKVSHDLSKFLHLWQYDSAEPPNLAHRLDKDVSGVLLLTRHRTAASEIAQLFHDRKIIKKYWAITVGVPKEERGSVEIPVCTRNVATNNKGGATLHRVVLRRDLFGRASLPKGVDVAHTNYQLLSVCEKAPKKCALIGLQSLTGVRHQLRLHLADGLMCPVLGDHKFGVPLLNTQSNLWRKLHSMNFEPGYLYLHACRVEIPGYHSNNSKPLVVKAPCPPYMERTLKLLGLTLPS